jgi:hypothetical protein
MLEAMSKILGGDGMKTADNLEEARMIIQDRLSKIANPAHHGS